LSGVAAARLEAQVLAAHASGMNRTGVLTHPSAVVPPSAEELLSRRLAGEPLAYILGQREFFSRNFLVSPAVLIPRQETETLVEFILEKAPFGASVLDVGTGSGCIGLTLKLERADLHVSVLDISEAALEVARENAERLHAEVTFIRSDLFESVHECYNVIVSNPPYIEDSAVLPVEIRDHEPATALFAGADGLIVYRRLAADCGRMLKPGGLIALEVGDGMHHQVANLFDHGWKSRETRADLSGMERVFAAWASI
jgi:release factor glutamine methyltransferase